MDGEPEFARAVGALRRHYGHAAFRPPQEPVVRAMLAGRDVLAVLPTGAGKSVCFQVPALVTGGLTLVVSPLISLMEDQVAAARARGLPAAALTSATPAGERVRVRSALERGELRLLYVSPERLGTAELRARLEGSALRRVAVDEAHCISEWGHDFRPAYRRIRDFCLRAGAPPVAAFTATATPATRADIETSLGLRDPVRVLARVDRPNLWWGVVRAPSPPAGARRLIEIVRRERGAAIAYVPTRERAVRLAEALLRRGVTAAPYHAGLSAAARRRVQEEFLRGRHRVVCATTAFGMGIDHPHVRLVGHLGMPGSLEAYVQEGGRAGRDGEPSRCILVRVPGDLALQRRLAVAAWPSPRLLAAVWRAMPEGRPVSPADVRRRLGRRVAEERVAAAMRLLVGAGAARGASRPGAEAATRGPEPLRRRIDFGAPARGRRRALARLAAMRGYAAGRACRRVAIASYFGEPPPACAGCDRCEAGRR